MTDRQYELSAKKILTEIRTVKKVKVSIPNEFSENLFLKSFINYQASDSISVILCPNFLLGVCGYEMNTIFGQSELRQYNLTE